MSRKWIFCTLLMLGMSSRWASAQIDLQLTVPFKPEIKDEKPKVTSETEIFKDEKTQLLVQRLSTISEGINVEIFRLIKREGKKDIKVDLEEIFGPGEQVDTFTIEGGEFQDGRIKVNVLREGVYDYRGTSKITYNVVWDEEKKKFSTVTRDETTATSMAERALRASLSHKCNALLIPDKKTYLENVSCYEHHETFLYYQKLYSIVFQEMHRCAQWYRATKTKLKAAELLAKTIQPDFKNKAEDWICSACHAEGENPAACLNREEYFFGEFLSDNPIVATDYAQFLSEFKKYQPLATKIFTSMVEVHPDNAQARLNFADDLWRRGLKTKAKEEYTQFLFLSHGLGALKESKARATSRGGKPPQMLLPEAPAPDAGTEP